MYREDFPMQLPFLFFGYLWLSKTGAIRCWGDSKTWWESYLFSDFKLHKTKCLSETAHVAQIVYCRARAGVFQILFQQIFNRTTTILYYKNNSTYLRKLHDHPEPTLHEVIVMLKIVLPKNKCYIRT